MVSKSFIIVQGCIAVMLMCSISLHAQKQDELKLEIEKLDWEDIKQDELLSTTTKVISGSRSEKDIDDLPFTVYVIEGEEIRRNGYVTLTDVLKRLPGIRVSQPGSALEGETFLMRGLLGNSYAKILINDVPIKPFLVNGMPIGAQLPIREAERIEIIYGPAATLYGADASAGVINIILKEKERPVYVQSDMGFGVLGFENLDMMFSGKIGKNKNVITLTAFGSYTALADRNIKYGLDSVYNPNIYQRILQPLSTEVPYVNRSNYVGNDSVPFLGELPHESNSLGLTMQYRDWELSFFRFARQDHSSLGLSPYAVSYANPLNFFGENINSIRLTFKKPLKRFNLKTGLHLLTYNTNDRSSYSYVVPLINYIQQSALEGNPDADSLGQVIDNRYFSRSRFSAANSLEAHAEALLNFKLTDYLELSGGLNFQVGRGLPLHHFKPRPIISDVDQLTGVTTTTYFEGSSFLESHLNLKKWNIILGGQIFRRSTDFSGNQPVVFNPRFAFQYRFTDQFSVRASSSRSFRYPSPFYSANSFSVSRQNPGVITTGAVLDPERTLSSEVGFRWNIGTKIRSDVTFYRSRTTNFINYAMSTSVNQNRLSIGYVNDAESFATSYGLQSRITFDDIIEPIGLGGAVNLNYSKGEESFTVIALSASDNLTVNLDGLRSQPSLIAQVDIECTPFKRTRLLFENTWVSKSRSRNFLLYLPQNSRNESRLFNDGYYTLDITGHVEFNPQLLVFLKVNNVFNVAYAGIDATNDADGLIYTPQPLRVLRFGVSYRLE